MIQLETADWLFNTGLVGIVNILETANAEYTLKNNRLEFDSAFLDHFAEDYFRYFEERYIDHVTYTTIVKKGQVFLELKDWDEKNLEDWNKYIERTKTYLKSNSYKAAYEMISNKSLDVLETEKNLKKINLKKNQTISDIQQEIEINKQLIEALVNFFKQPEVKKYIVAKNIAYSVVDNFWNGVSFLHKSSTKNDIYDEYDAYFIEPVRQYYQENHKKDKYSCFVCNYPINKLSKPSAYDLAWLNKMGVDMSRKSSHFWDLNSSTCYICPICNFVYSCVPAGFTVIRGQGYFININNDIQNLVRFNNNDELLATSEDETIQIVESRTYFQLLKFMEQEKAKQAAKEIENIQIVKYSNRKDNKTDKVRPYTFNVLSKDKLRVIQKYQKQLQSMVNRIVKLSDDSYINVYQNVLERLYQNKNQFDLIALLCRNNLPSKAEPMRGIGYIRDLIFLNNHFLSTIKKKKEDGSMSGYSSWVSRDTIQSIEKAGKKLAQAYSNKNATNKLSGITYRLLNALKTKNIGRFIDTFINAHLYGGLIVPPEIKDVLTDENKLQTLGYAFVIGLRSEKNVSGDNNENKEEKSDD